MQGGPEGGEVNPGSACDTTGFIMNLELEVCTLGQDVWVGGLKRGQ